MGLTQEGHLKREDVWSPIFGYAANPALSKGGILAMEKYGSASYAKTNRYRGIAYGPITRCPGPPPPPLPPVVINSSSDKNKSF